MENCEDLLERINKILSGNTHFNFDFTSIPKNFFQDTGLDLITLYKIDNHRVDYYAHFFSQDEWKKFIQYLKDNDEFEGRAHYDYDREKKYFSDQFFNPIDLIRDGWIPELDYFDTPNKKSFLVAMNGKIPEDTWKYFHEGVSANEYLRSRRIWVRCEREYESKNRALAMMFSNPELLWSSMRPKTDMKMFQQENYLIGKIDEGVLKVRDKKYRIYGQSSEENGEGVAFPVARYARTIDTGLYYDNPEDEGGFCGTFYYIEPESTVYLISNRAIFSRTKTSAAKMLASNRPGSRFSRQVFNMRELDMNRSRQFQMHELGTARKGFLYTPIQAYEELGFQGYGNPYAVTQYPVYLGATSIDRYKINSSGLYSSEDQYDQPLCREMKKQEIEVACLTEMIGAFGVVAEVLDSRERYESFANLVYT